MPDPTRIPLPYLLAALHRADFTGQLGLKQADVERTILMHNGSPVHVQSRLQEETLGRILLDEGRLDARQYERMLEDMARSRRPAGEVLIAMGVLGPQEVFGALEYQARLKLANSFRMVDFDFAIRPQPVPPEAMISRLDVFEALLGGILTGYSVDRLLGEFVVDEETVFRQTPGPTEQRLRIRPQEKRLLRSLGSGTALARLMAQGQDLRYLLAALYTFHSLGLVEASGLSRPSCPELELLAPARQPAAEAAPPTRAAEAEPAAPADLAGGDDGEFRQPTLANILDGKIDRRLADKVLRLGRQDHFALLGVGRQATGAELRLAYQQLLADHRLETIDQAYTHPKERELARRLLDQATVAYRVLSDEQARADYLRGLKTDRPAAEQPVPVRILADVEAHKGLLALRNKRWQEAEQLFERAIELYPDEPSYHFQIGKLGYTRALDQTPADQPLPEALRKPFLKALALDPRYDQPRLYLGYLAKRNGNLQQASREFAGALECNPRNQVAQSELRLIRRRLREPLARGE